MSTIKKIYITSKNVSDFEMLEPLLEELFNEIKELSKKKQDSVLNKFKVSMINKILVQIKVLLSSESTNQFLELLDEDSLPNNSDAVLVLSQFKSSMKQYKRKYYMVDEYEEWNWLVKN